MKDRLKEEEKACTEITGYFKRKGLGNFKYVTTRIDKGTLSGIVYDVEVLSGMTGVILKLYPKITDVLLSYSKEETADLDRYIKEKGTIEGFNPKHRYSKANSVAEIIAGRKYNYVLYREDKGIISKTQMIREMPEELFNMTWYCRKPRNGMPCGSCHTCKKVAKSKKQL